jgi:hypothetical protein
LITKPRRQLSSAVVDHHAELAERERGEHADGVQRDQRVRDPAERDDERGGRRGEKQDPVGEDEPVTAVAELARQISVAGDDRRQAGEVGVGGVRGEDEDRRRGELQHDVERIFGPEHRPPHLGDDGLLVTRERMKPVGEH